MLFQPLYCNPNLNKATCSSNARRSEGSIRTLTSRLADRLRTSVRLYTVGQQAYFALDKTLQRVQNFQEINIFRVLGSLLFLIYSLPF
jgi:hypothetical protein